MYKEEKYWEHGQLTRLAVEAKISKTTLSAILHRRLGVSKNRAFMLESLTYMLFKKRISWKEWLFNETTVHPAFFGNPRKK